MTDDSWVYIGQASEGEDFQIQDVNIWQHKWILTEQSISLLVPLSKKNFKFQIWKIEIEDRQITFAATDVSNGVFVFYCKNGKS